MDLNVLVHRRSPPARGPIHDKTRFFEDTTAPAGDDGGSVPTRMGHRVERVTRKVPRRHAGSCDPAH